MKFGMLSASVLLMTLSGCSLNEAEEDVGGAPGSWVNSGGSGPMAAAGSGPIGTGGGPAAGGATGSGGYGVGGTGAGGESSDCNEIVAECYSAAYACCGQGVDEQCEMMAGNCASIICENPYPYPLQCTDYIVPVDEAIDEAQAFELAVNTCANLGLTATGAELLELGVFVTCCPDPNGGMGTGAPAGARVAAPAARARVQAATRAAPAGMKWALVATSRAPAGTQPVAPPVQTWARARVASRWAAPGWARAAPEW